MRAVSFFGLEESAPDKVVTGTGAWTAGDGFVESGGELAVMGRPRGRSELERQVLKRATALLECEEAACLTAGEGQAGFARFRAILYLEPGGFATGGCGRQVNANGLFFWFV